MLASIKTFYSVLFLVSFFHSLSSSYDFLVNSFLRTLRVFLRLCVAAESSGLFSDSPRAARLSQSPSADTTFFRHTRSSSMLFNQPHPFITLDPLWTTLFRWYDMLGDELKFDSASAAIQITPDSAEVTTRRFSELSNSSGTTVFSHGRTVSGISSSSASSKDSTGSGHEPGYRGNPLSSRSLHNAPPGLLAGDAQAAGGVPSSFSMPQLPTNARPGASPSDDPAINLTEETKQAVTALVESTPVQVRAALLQGHSLDSQWWRGMYRAPLVRKLSRSPRVQKHEHWGGQSKSVPLFFVTRCGLVSSPFSFFSINSSKRNVFGRLNFVKTTALQNHNLVTLQTFFPKKNRC